MIDTPLSGADGLSHFAMAACLLIERHELLVEVLAGPS